MAFLFRSIFFSFIALTLLCGLLLTQLLEKTPQNPFLWQPNAQFARVIFKKASTQTLGKQDLSLDQAELNHLANSVLNRYLVSTTQIKLYDNDMATVVSTLHLSKLLQGYFLNIQFQLDNQQQGLSLRELHIGQLIIPRTISHLLMTALLQHSILKQYTILAAQHIQGIHIKHEQLIAHYVLETQNTGVANTIDPVSVKFYQQQIDSITAQHDPHWRLSLADLLCPLFRIAEQRSTVKTAISENIAIMVAVSAYINSNELPFYIALTPATPPLHQYPVYLFKRTDQAKHFMLSAVLTLSAGAGLADFMGQEKELRDAQSSSGFSFVDLAADRAGMAFSVYATRSPSDAQAFQRVMANSKDYTVFMPDIKGLPENLTRSQFNQQFDAIDSAAYQAMLQTIDQRIATLPLYQALKRE